MKTLLLLLLSFPVLADYVVEIDYVNHEIILDSGIVIYVPDPKLIEIGDEVTFEEDEDEE